MIPQINTLIEYIQSSHSIVFFGGAGVSTESGIPDFRSKDGLYNQHDIQFEKYRPEYLLSHECLIDEPKVFYEYYRQKMDARGFEPNITHKVLAKLEEQGKLKAVITQNIDGLHQKAGSKAVYELHGTTERNYCSWCKKAYPSDYIFTSGEPVPKCECGGMVRPYVTLYGEGLPEDAWNQSIAALKSADMLIVAGTSLMVYPAANLVRYFAGDHLVVMNREKLKLPINEETDLVIQGSMGEVFRELERISFIE